MPFWFVWQCTHHFIKTMRERAFQCNAMLLHAFQILLKGICGRWKIELKMLCTHNIIRIYCVRGCADRVRGMALTNQLCLLVNAIVCVCVSAEFRKLSGGNDRNYVQMKRMNFFRRLFFLSVRNWLHRPMWIHIHKTQHRTMEHRDEHELKLGIAE